ncbi:MAG: hypothetical protein Q4G68_02335 [Planctomycetia bacterium]|nr:hypothetical protein [Planctomycetia bacterium]
MRTSWQDMIRDIHASPIKISITATGGGTQAIALLTAIPGASQTILNASVPYSFAAVDRELGHTPDSYCSPATAAELAMKAYINARELAAPDTDPNSLIGIGVTASLATGRVKRGEHRVFIAAQSRLTCSLLSHVFNKERNDRTRATEERIVARLTLALLKQRIHHFCQNNACNGVPFPDCLKEKLNVAPVLVKSRHPFGRSVPCPEDESRSCTTLFAPEYWASLLFTNFTTRSSDESTSQPPALLWRKTNGICQTEPSPGLALFSGSFNPIHRGHIAIQKIASQVLNQQVAFELPVRNADKPPLNYLELYARGTALLRAAPNAELWLTSCPLFLDKIKMFPKATFVLGADTFERLVMPCYYPSGFNAAMTALAQGGARFLVFARMMNGNVRSLNQITVPDALRDRCSEIPASVFLDNISSTEIRKKFRQY